MKRLLSPIAAMAGVASVANAQLPYERWDANFGEDWRTFGFVGDINNDGIDDLFAGNGSYTFDENTGRGRARIYSGKDASILQEKIGEWQQGFGTVIAPAGDVDNDGHDDYLLGSPFEIDDDYDFKGHARLFSGRTGGLLHTFIGAPGDRLGAYLSGVGDLNNDGHDDLLIGRHLDGTNGSRAGKVTAISGADYTTELFTVLGDGPNEWFGSGLGSAGDVNADGTPDLYVYGNGNHHGGGSSTGRVSVLSGVDGSELYAWVGLEDDGFGSGVDAAGDVNGDGHDDLIITAYNPENGDGRVGSVSVYSGKDGSVYFHTAVYGDGGSFPDNAVGSSAIGLGDVSGDGFADFAYRIEGTEGSTQEFASMRVVSGRDLSTLDVLTADPVNYSFGVGFRVPYLGMGDLNGDDRADFIIGDGRDPFLVFRSVGTIPEPTTLALVAIGAVVVTRRIR